MKRNVSPHVLLVHKKANKRRHLTTYKMLEAKKERILKEWRIATDEEYVAYFKEKGKELIFKPEIKAKNEKEKEEKID